MCFFFVSFIYLFIYCLHIKLCLKCSLHSHLFKKKKKFLLENQLLGTKTAEMHIEQYCVFTIYINGVMEFYILLSLVVAVRMQYNMLCITFSGGRFKW